MSLTATLEGAKDLQAAMSEEETMTAEMTLGGEGGGGGASVLLTSVTLLASAWLGDNSPYYQVVAVEGATKRSLVDLQPSVEQLQIFHEKDLAFTTENDNGVITVYAIGDKPTGDYVIQATVMEVVA